MDAASERRRGDVAKLERLCSASGGRMRIISRDGNPPTSVTLEINCRTPGSVAYPADAITQTRVRIEMPSTYPLRAPQVYVAPVTFHPNVFSSGLVCLGAKWLPTEGLDLLVKRVVQIITFDPAVVNTASPANPTASSWYLSVASRSRALFPTDNLPFLSEARPTVKPVWRNLSTAPAPAARAAPATPAERGTSSWRDVTADSTPPGRRLIRCAQCDRTLRVPDVEGTRVRCPACRHLFRVAS